MFRATRTAAVLLLATTVGAGSAFAPEHAHQRDDRHPNATVHRHFASHDDGHAPDHPQVDDDDDRVIWLTTAWLRTAVYHGPSLAGTPATGPGFVPATVRWTAIVLDEAAPPHGPPRDSHSSRAPPLPA